GRSACRPRPLPGPRAAGLRGSESVLRWLRPGRGFRPGLPRPLRRKGGGKSHCPGRQTRGRPVMNLVQLLLRSSRRTTLLAVAAGLAGGACSVGLIALIQAALASAEASAGLLAWGFAGLCLAVLLTRVASQALLIRLAQGSVARLYTHLSR